MATNVRERSATAKIGLVYRSGVTLAARWARTVSNRRPLVCKSRPGRLPRFTQCDDVYKCPAQRLFGFRCVPAVSRCFCPSWHTLGTTGVWSSGVAARAVAEFPSDLTANVEEVVLRLMQRVYRDPKQ